MSDLTPAFCPNVRPDPSIFWDVSYEMYFGTKAYVAVAAFHKKLVSYICTQNKDYDL
jgi:hypothetical protein